MSVMMRSRGSGAKKGLVILVVIIIVIILAFCVISISSSNNEFILKGVTINNTIDIGGMDQEEAFSTLADYESQLQSKPYIVRFDNKKVEFYGRTLGVSLNKDILDEAIKIGKSGNIITNGIDAIQSFFGAKHNLDAEIYYNEGNLNQKIEELISTTKPNPLDSTYTIDKEKGIIEISKGHDGIKVKYSSLRDKIVDSLADASEGTDIVLEADINRAKEVDFDKLYDEIYVKAKDASLDKDGNYVQEQEGVSFDKNKALKDYRALADDSKMTIKLETQQPKVTTKNLESVLFADVLGEYSTKYDASNTDRSTNLALAANNINGKVLLPGDVFSYNEEVGERTAARGFKSAHIFSGGRVENGLGGGICQISSTLYCATLISDLEIVARSNHQMYPQYIPQSLDATVAWPSVDFKFKNSRTSPIKIEASAKGGVAKVIIWGKKEEDEPIITLESKVLSTFPFTTKREPDPNLAEGKEITIQNPVNGYKSEGYKVYKDIKGKEIKRVLITTDNYASTDKIVSYGTKKAAVVTPPPVVTPPKEDPPVVTPPKEDPPVVTPPKEDPPVVTPPIEDPPVVTPPVEDPPVVTPPEDDPSTGLPTGWDTPENPYYKG